MIAAMATTVPKGFSEDVATRLAACVFDEGQRCE
jgi:hypothetical protein